MLMATSYATAGNGASATRSGGTVAPLAVNGDFYAPTNTASTRLSGCTTAPTQAAKEAIQS